MLKTSFSKYLNLDVEIYRSKRDEENEDEVGGFDTDFILVGIVKGRISRKNSNEGFVGGQHQGIIDLTLYVKGGTDIKRDDEIVAKGIRYRVITHVNPSQIDHHLEVKIEEIQSE